MEPLLETGAKLLEIIGLMDPRVTGHAEHKSKGERGGSRSGSTKRARVSHSRSAAYFVLVPPSSHLEVEESPARVCNRCRGCIAVHHSDIRYTHTDSRSTRVQVGIVLIS